MGWTPGFQFLARAGIYLAPHPEQCWGPPILLSSGYRGSFSGGKVAGV